MLRVITDCRGDAGIRAFSYCRFFALQKIILNCTLCIEKSPFGRTHIGRRQPQSTSFCANTVLPPRVIRQDLPAASPCLAQKIRCFAVQAVLRLIFFVRTKHKNPVILSDTGFFNAVRAENSGSKPTASLSECALHSVRFSVDFRSGKFLENYHFDLAAANGDMHVVGKPGDDGFFKFVPLLGVFFFVFQ